MASAKEFPLLLVDLSAALLECMEAGEVSLDGVEVGPWFTLEQVRAYRQKLPALPFFFHAADLIDEVGEIPGAEERISAYLESTLSPWLSVHLSIWGPGMLARLRKGERLPLPQPEKALQVLLHRLERLVRLTSIPVLVENVEPLPFEGYDFWSRPEFICKVFDKSGCGFLLDTGHARVSSDRLDMDMDTYLSQLPLECIMEIHVSSPRRRQGQLVDVHAPLHLVDYHILESLLVRAAPRAVTLEFIRDRRALREQLTRLHRLPGLGGSPTRGDQKGGRYE